MRESTPENRNRIQWNFMNQLDDLDFLMTWLFYPTLTTNLKKKSILAENASKTGLRINKEKTKLIRIYTNNINNIEVDDAQLENVTSFIYLGRVVNHRGGTDEDVKSRLAKANTLFI